MEEQAITIQPQDTKIDALAMAGGKAIYGADWAIAKMGREPLVAKILHSQICGVNIADIDLQDALATPGVRSILTYQNAPAFFSPCINKVGEPIAVVAATTAAIAKTALKAIHVDYTGPAEEVITNSPDQKYWQPLTLERPCCTGYLDETNRLVLVTANQDPFEVRRQVAARLGFPLQRIRIINCRVGGNFGARTGWTLESLVAALVLTTKQPVQLELCQEELLYLNEQMDSYYNEREKVLADARALNILVRQQNLDPLTCFFQQKSSDLPPDIQVALRECYEQGAIKIGWKQKQIHRHQQNQFLYGIGVALVCQQFPTLAPTWACTIRQQNEDGSCQVLSGLADDGSGSETLLAQLAAQEYGLSLEQVIIHSGDTDLATDPRRADCTNNYVWACAAHFAEVAIDQETGEIKVINYALSAASQGLLNQSLAYNQLSGAVLWGITNCLAWEQPSDKSGKSASPLLTGPALFSTADMPQLTSVIKPIGQPVGAAVVSDLTNLGSFGVAPAIANAINDACGLHLDSTPFTPERILSALKEK